MDGLSGLLELTGSPFEALTLVLLWLIYRRLSEGAERMTEHSKRIAVIEAQAALERKRHPAAIASLILGGLILGGCEARTESRGAMHLTGTIGEEPVELIATSETSAHTAPDLGRWAAVIREGVKGDIAGAIDAALADAPAEPKRDWTELLLALGVGAAGAGGIVGARKKTAPREPA